MYNPRCFKSENLDDAFALMASNPFATVISSLENRPIISHLPIVSKFENNKIELIGHLSKTNPHWKILDKTPVTAIFHGPHTYITPQWYSKNNAPTWNYSVVHTEGTVSLIEDYEGILGCLKELSSHAENLWPSGWEFFVPDDLQGKVLTSRIVGFRIGVEEINFKRKLSQNNTQVDQEGALSGLESRTDENSQLVLRDMLQPGRDKKALK